MIMFLVGGFHTTGFSKYITLSPVNATGALENCAVYSLHCSSLLLPHVELELFSVQN